MEVSALKAHIQSDTIPNILFFTGDEWAVQDIYIKQIAKKKELETKRIDSIADVVGKFKSQSFVQKNYMYIARDDSEYMQNEKLQELVRQTIGNNMFVLLVTTVDKRTKFYKAYSDSIFDFEPLKPAILAKYIARQINLSKDSIEKLMEVCAYDYGRCLLEIDKIKNYNPKDDSKLQYDADFNMLLEDGTIHTPPKDAIFEFVDAILDRKTSCFDLYEQCKAVGEAVMVMLSVLYNNAKAVLQVQSCKSNDISKTTGLTGWQIMNAKKHTGNYKNSELVNIMRICTECEQGIKTGQIEEQFVMEYILVNVL